MTEPGLILVTGAGGGTGGVGGKVVALLREQGRAVRAMAHRDDSRAGAVLRNVGGSFDHFVAQEIDRGHVLTLASPPDAWGGRAAVAWVDALARGAGFNADAERLVDHAMLIDRCYEVAARRRPQSASLAGSVGRGA